jgi:hypothetical protein
MGMFDWVRSEAQDYGLIAPPPAADTVADMQPFVDTVGTQNANASIALDTGVTEGVNRYDAYQNDQTNRNNAAQQQLEAEEATGVQLTPAQKKAIYDDGYRNSSTDGMSDGNTDPNKDPFYQPDMEKNPYYTN